jgi:hypothetical protein
MNRSDIIKWLLILVIAGVVLGAGAVYYMFTLPHQDVQGSQTEFTLTVDQLVNEYLTDPDAADLKYLDEEGFSGILEITGRIQSRTLNFVGQTTVYLSPEAAPTGIRCTILNDAALALLPDDGANVTLKGVIRTGAFYDEELNAFGPVIMDQCAPKL